MRKLLILVLVGLIAVACNTATPDSLELEAQRLQFNYFRAHLSGGQEVPPADTQAQGQAIFQLSRDGTKLSYRVIVANIDNVTMAHIHTAPAGANGPVVAWLYPSTPPAQLIPGRFSGVLAEGVITSDDLVGPLAGGTLADLITALRAGNTYVNVHTSQFPAGEVRGQIQQTRILRFY